MRAVDIIAKKRDGRGLSREEVSFFVTGVTAGTLPDYQASALLMAIVLRGMSEEETVWLTEAMVGSGARIDLHEIPGAKVDKHSTGGVGDKASLVVAPLVAACGAAVPMMAGRGLGHTGGTLDKLEAIPGFRVNLSLDEMKRSLERIGCVIVGPPAEIAPADRRLYALRDVTATVESIPLLCGSIMSKKIAEGIDALVLDVKTGSGAFMKTEEQSRRLAESLVSIGKASGLRTEAVITAMEAPLGYAVGNALEVAESIEVLKGRGPADVTALSVELAARMLVIGGVASSRDQAERLVAGALDAGTALETFRRMVEAQGGDSAVVDNYGRLPAVSDRHLVRAARTGFLTGLDAELVGRASVALGAGRDRVEDTIDPGVGVAILASPGVRLAEGEGILELHYRDRRRLETAVELATRSITIGDSPPEHRPLVLGEVK